MYTSYVDTRSRSSAPAAVVFLIVLIVVSYITMRIADLIIDSRIGALDRTLGFVFGAARGILLAAVAMLVPGFFTAKQPESPGSTAKSKPMLDSLGAELVNMLPEDADATILERLRGGSETWIGCSTRTSMKIPAGIEDLYEGFRR
jgi:membrane protein required for colicin V production